MKRFLFFMAVLLTGGQAVAQEVEETKTLSEVTIHGARIVQRVDGQTIYPTQQQVASSTNGYSLLEKLTLPRVRVDPIMHTITALSNDGNVQVRINDVLAKREDLLALEVEAVERIDYIENPGLRYGEDVACVINIIIKKPSSGYVLGADLTNTLTTVNGDETFYGRLNHRKSEFGATYSLDYNRFTGLRYDERATYEMESGTLASVNRHQVKGTSSQFSHNGQLTYSLTDSSFVFQAKMNANKSLRPSHSYTQMQVNGDVFNNNDFSNVFSPSIDIYYHRDFTRHASLTTNVVGTHIRTKNQVENNEGGDYRYSVLGKTWALWGETLYENRLKPFTFSGGLQYAQKYMNNQYEGSTNAVNHMHSSNIYLFGQLKGALGKWIYLVGLGTSWLRYRQAATHYQFWLFRPKFSLTYPLAKRLKMKYDFEISQHVSQIALVSDVSIKRNAYETLVGNPSIKPNRVTSHNISFVYSTPRLTTQLQGYYRLNAHCNMEKYIRKEGHFYHTQTNADNTCSFFFIENYNSLDLIPEHLSLSLSGGIWRFFNHGEGYNHTYTSFNGRASITAYLDKWTLGAYVDNGWHFMEGEHRGHQAPAWYVSASYRVKQLTVSLYAQHLMSAVPYTNKTEVLSQYVNKQAQRRNADFGNMITLNLTWRLSAGRKYHDIHRTMNHRDTETGIMK